MPIVTGRVRVALRRPAFERPLPLPPTPARRCFGRPKIAGGPTISVAARWSQLRPFQR